MSDEDEPKRRSLPRVVALSPAAIVAIVLLVGSFVYAVVAALSWWGPYKEDVIAACEGYSPDDSDLLRARWDWWPPEWRCVYRLPDGSIVSPTLAERKTA